jgi:D-3-phosphoglycerate dehydrogenase / 2-oxoglutarate reductase
MDPTPPALLVAVTERPGMREAIARALPSVPFAFLADTPPADPSRVEAVLLGSIARDAASWEPGALPRLRFVQRIFTGVDDLPFERFPASVRIAGNVGGYAPFVAEHALALALAAGRGVRDGVAAVASGRARPAPELRSLYRETVVILGFGAIGSALADRLRPFQVRLVGLNRTGAPAPDCPTMFGADRLREAVALGAVVFEVRPLTRRTRGSLGAAELAAMREDATLVNVGRGPTVDEEALYRHLLAHPRFRAALDVWWEEDLAHGKLASRFPFAELPNFVGTPHWAGFAPGVAEHALGTALENLGRFFRGEPPRHVVDRAEYVEAARGG